MAKTIILNVYLVVLYATIIHFIWAILLIIDTSPLNITAMGTLAIIFNRQTLIFTLFAVAFSALVGMRSNFPGSFLLLIPQQIILFISAGAAIRAMIIAQFADGVIRPRGFLIADQAPAVLAALLHFAATIHKMAFENWEKRRIEQ